MVKKYISLFLLVVMALSMPCLWAQAKFNAEEMLPAKTLLYASITDGKKLCEDMQQLGLWQLFQSREWQDFFATLPAEYMQQFEMQKKMVEEQLGMPVAKMLEIFHGQISLAVVGMAEGAPVPIVVLTWDLGAQKETFAQLFAAVRQQLYPMAKGMSEDNIVIDGHPVVMIMTPVKMPVFLTYVDTTMVVCSDRNFLETLIVAGKKTAEPLATYPAYARVKKELLGERAGKILYANVKAIAELGLAMAGPRKQQQIAPILEMSGLNKLEALGLGVSFRNGQVAESIYLYTPEGRTGILGGIVPALYNEGLLASYMPENVIGFNHGCVDLLGMYKTYMGLFEQIAPREYQGLMQMKQGFEEDFGVSLEQDILAAIGNEYLSSFSLSGGIIPDFAIQFAVKDMEKFRATLDKLLAVVPKKYRYDFTWNGHNFTYFNFSTMKQPMPIAPTIALENNRLLVTLFPETAKNLITQSKGQLPADCLKYVDGRKYTVTEYLNIKAIAGPIYRTVVPLAQAMVPRAKSPVELALLPSAQTVESYLNNAVFIAMHNTDGMLWEFHSPFGVMPFVVAGGAAGALIPKQAKRHYRRYEPPVEKPIEKPIEKKPAVAPQDNGDGIKSSLLSLEEKRNWKSSDAELESVLQNVWVSNSSMNLKLHVPIPPNTFAYGNFVLNTCQDNTGNSLLPGDTSSMSQVKKFYAYELEKVRENKGYNFDLEVGSPARGANNFTIKGQFTLKLAGETVEVTVPEYGKWKAEGHQAEGVAIKVMPAGEEASSIKLEVSEDIMKLVNVLVVDGDNKEVPNGYNYYQNEGVTTITYWFNKPVPDNATIVIQYLKSIEDKTVVIDINNQNLP